MYENLEIKILYKMLQLASKFVFVSSSGGKTS